MTKEQKNEVVDFLGEQFKASEAIIVCDYKGISHKNLEDLRKMAKENNTTVRVAKNRLVNVALKNIKLEQLELTGANIYLWSDDQISACKVAAKFAKTQEKFTLKTGIIEGKTASIETIDTFAKLPSKDELIGMLLSVWTAPVRNFVTGLDNLRTKKEEDAA